MSRALLEGLPEDERMLVERLQRPFTAERGETLFHHGDPGDGMILIERGTLAITRPAPHGRSESLGTVGPGDVLGELSLLGPGTRTATVTATTPVHGHVVDRDAFAALRAAADVLVGRLGQLALVRLRDRIAALSAAVGAEPPSAEPALQEAAEPLDDGEIAGTLLFARIAAHVPELVAGLRQLDAPRGAPVPIDGALLVVVRGAVEVDLRGPHVVRRLRLAGPGRAVNHLGDFGPAQAFARERAILLEVPWERVRARPFAPAFGEDVVRALAEAERPVATLRPRAEPSWAG